MSGIYPLSFSRSQIFEQCELRFERQYVIADVTDPGSDASRYGNRVHESFEGYLKSDTPLPPEQRVFLPLLDKVKKAPGDKHYEYHMAVRRDKTPCAWDDPDCWFRGIADFAVVNGILGTVGDWKTGKPKNDSLQLMLMACLMFEHFPELISVSTAYIWLYHPTAAAPAVVHNRWSLADYWAVFEEKAALIDAAVTAGVYRPKPSGLCGWCPAYDTCTHRRNRR